MIDSAIETGMRDSWWGNFTRKIADNTILLETEFFLAFRNVTDPEVVAGRHHEWLELGGFKKPSMPCTETTLVKWLWQAPSGGLRVLTSP